MELDEIRRGHPMQGMVWMTKLSARVLRACRTLGARATLHSIIRGRFAALLAVFAPLAFQLHEPGFLLAMVLLQDRHHLLQFGDDALGGLSAHPARSLGLPTLDSGSGAFGA